MRDLFSFYFSRFIFVSFMILSFFRCFFHVLFVSFLSRNFYHFVLMRRIRGVVNFRREGVSVREDSRMTGGIPVAVGDWEDTSPKQFPKMKLTMPLELLCSVRNI